jgi:ParB-like chromosome segregation protein Spo0J
MTVSQPYQVMPEMAPEEFAALKADIDQRGIQVPIDVDEDGNILDGHHRHRAWQELLRNSPPPTRVISGLSESEKRSFARKNNILRRHLSRDQVRDLIAQQLKETPDWAARRIGRELGVDHKTVSAERDRLVATGEIPQLEKVVGSDGKQRRKPIGRQPARKVAPDDEWPSDPVVDDLFRAWSLVVTLPGGEAVAQQIAQRFADHIASSASTAKLLPYPAPNITDDEARLWGRFAQFLVDKYGWDADSAGSHVDWILRRDFKTPDEWLGPEGARFRARQEMREPHPDVTEAWAAFKSPNFESEAA